MGRGSPPIDRRRRAFIHSEEVSKINSLSRSADAGQLAGLEETPAPRELLHYGETYTPTLETLLPCPQIRRTLSWCLANSVARGGSRLESLSSPGGYPRLNEGTGPEPGSPLCLETRLRGGHRPCSPLAVLERGAGASRGCEGYMVTGGPPSRGRGRLWVETPRRAEFLDRTPPGYSGRE